MRVVMVSPEVVPFAKTGGLADVVGALPRSIAERGADVSVIMPKYRETKKPDLPMKKSGIKLSVAVGGKSVTSEVWQGTLPHSNVPVYLLEMDHYFDRDFLYGTSEGDYRDNSERFVFFCRGALELIKTMNPKPDIVHCHDWQSALIPIYMKTLYRQDVGKAKSVITIHNMAYQGTFWHWDMPLTGLDWKHFNWKELEFYGKINFLKGGIIYSDGVTTVSKGYAQEIQTKEFGCGLEGALVEKSRWLTGIVNGIDERIWNPATDKLIPATYGPGKTAGKAACKASLQKKCGLAVRKDVPLVGLIGRLAEQKGVDLVAAAIEKLIQQDIQFVLLGRGEVQYQDMLSALQPKYPGKVALRLAFDEQLAHEIEAGSDMFMMPSRYEPCGLNQLYSLKYGTIPIVRRTGGLADTVTDCCEETINRGTATGFVFKEYDADAFRKCVERAVALYRTPAQWRKVMKNAMTQDWSWNRSAAEYIEFYCRLP